MSVIRHPCPVLHVPHDFTDGVWVGWAYEKHDDQGEILFDKRSPGIIDLYGISMQVSCHALPGVADIIYLGKKEEGNAQRKTKNKNRTEQNKEAQKAGDRRAKKRYFLVVSCRQTSSDKPRGVEKSTEKKAKLRRRHGLSESRSKKGNQ